MRYAAVAKTDFAVYAGAEISMAISKSGAQCVARRREEFAAAVARWPYPETFAGMDLLDIVGFPGNKMKLAEYHRNGMIEVAAPKAPGGGKRWRFARWVCEKFDGVAE